MVEMADKYVAAQINPVQEEEEEEEEEATRPSSLLSDLSDYESEESDVRSESLRLDVSSCSSSESEPAGKRITPRLVNPLWGASGEQQDESQPAEPAGFLDFLPSKHSVSVKPRLHRRLSVDKSKVKKALKESKDSAKPAGFLQFVNSAPSGGQIKNKLKISSSGAKSNPGKKGKLRTDSIVPLSLSYTSLPEQQQQQHQPIFPISEFLQDLLSNCATISIADLQQRFRAGLIDAVLNSDNQSCRSTSRTCLVRYRTEMFRSAAKEEKKLRKFYERVPKCNSGVLLFMGFFVKDFEYSVNKRLEELMNSKCPLPETQYIYNLTQSMNVNVLEERHNLISLCTDLACSPNSYIALQEGDMIHVGGPKQIGPPICTGIMENSDSNTEMRLDSRCPQSVISIAAGPYHMALITSNNALFTWGINLTAEPNSYETEVSSGRLGYNHPVSVPRMVPLPHPALKVSCGANHTMILTTGGVYTCGGNQYGQLGRPTQLGISYESSPKLIPESQGWKCIDVCAGAFHSLILTASGRLMGCGDNEKGQLGLPLGISSVSSPRQLVTTITMIAAGRHHTLARSTKGELVAWGSHAFGQLGIGKLPQPHSSGGKDILLSGSASISTTQSQNNSISMPVIVDYKFDSEITHLSCGPYSSIATTVSGNAYIWGLLCSPHLTNHQYTPRLLSICNGSSYISKAEMGCTHIVAIEDKAKSDLKNVMMNVCSFTGTSTISQLKLLVLSMPDHSRILKPIQDSVMQTLLKKNSNHRLITVDNAALYYTFPTPRPITQTIAVRNISRHKVSLHASLTHYQEDNNLVSVSIKPDVLQLAKGGTQSLKISIRPLVSLSKEMVLLLGISVVKPGQTQDLSISSCYYVFLFVKPATGTAEVSDSSDSSLLIENMNMALDIVNNFRQYVPRLLVRKLLHNQFAVAAQESFLPAAIIFLDISGFTQLTHKISELGDAGSDLISKHLNAYFGQLIHTIESHGGDLVKSAGDALICIFTDRKTEISGVSKEMKTDDPTLQPILRKLALMAIHCGLEIEKKFPIYDSGEGFTLTLHIGIGVGLLRWMMLGGVNRRWEYIIAGDLLTNIKSTIEASHQSEVIVSKFCWELVQDLCTGTQRGKDYHVISVVPEMVPRILPAEDSFIEACFATPAKRSHHGSSNKERKEGVEVSSPSVTVITTSNSLPIQQKEAEALTQLDMSFLANPSVSHSQMSPSRRGSISDRTPNSCQDDIACRDSEFGARNNLSDPERCVTNLHSSPTSSKPTLDIGVNMQTLLELEIPLRSFVRIPVQKKVDSLGNSLLWMNEMRTITSVFITLEVMGVEFESLQQAVCCIQTELFRLEGIVCQFLQDDKGTIAFAGFGPPPASHADDPVRAVKASVAIYQSLKRMRVQSHIGIATGTVFAGTFGSDKRTEYTLLGDSVNMASRLMSAAASRDLPIICDKQTFKSCEMLLSFEEMEPIVVKGKSEPMETYPVSLSEFSDAPEIRLGRRTSLPTNIRGRHPSVDHKEESSLKRSQMVGRGMERHRLFDALAQLRNTTRLGDQFSSKRSISRGKVIIIEGEEGMGKSRLLEECLLEARRTGIEVLFSECDPVHLLTPYYALGSILKELVKLDTHDPYLAIEALENMIDDNWKDFLPLLTVVLPSLPFTQEQKASVNATTTKQQHIYINNLIIHLLEVVSSQIPLLVTIDNAHWLDSLTINILDSLQTHVPTCTVIMTSRPMAEEVMKNFNSIIQCPDTEILALKPLSSIECLDIIARLVGVKALPDEVLNAVSNLQGNPLFCEILVSMLLINPEVSIKDGRMELPPNFKLSLPTSIDGIVSSRLDNLPISVQTIVQVASVIGNTFTRENLEKVYSLEEIGSTDEQRTQTIEKSLSYLVKNNFIAYSASSDLYQFKNDIYARVAYSRLLVSRRKALHAKIISLIEESARERNEKIPDSELPVLAYHYVSLVHSQKQPPTDTVVKAIEYLLQSADVEYSTEAKEASHMIREALSLAKTLPDSVSQKKSLMKTLRLRMVGTPMTDLMASGESAPTKTFLLGAWGLRPQQSNEKGARLQSSVERLRPPESGARQMATAKRRKRSNSDPAIQASMENFLNKKRESTTSSTERNHSESTLLRPKKKGSKTKAEKAETAPLDVSIILEGPLQYRTYLRKWETAYFILTSDSMMKRYSTKPKDRKKAEKEFNVSLATVLEQNDPKKPFNFTLSRRNHPSLLFRALSNEQKEKWILQLQECSVIPNLVVDPARFTLTAVVTATETGKITGFNKKAEELFGYTAAEVVGKNVKTLMPKTLAKQHDKFISNYIRTQKRQMIGIPTRVKGQRKDGSPVEIILSLGEYYENGARMFIANFRPYARLTQDMQILVRRMDSIDQEEVGYAAPVSPTSSGCPAMYPAPGSITTPTAYTSPSTPANTRPNSGTH